MYLIRRVYNVKPRTAMKVAEVLANVAQIYEKSGQRGPTKIYFNGGTLPGENNVVYMEWEDESIMSPYRGDNKIPPEVFEVGRQVREHIIDQRIEFFELINRNK
ncbi:MAG: hypothetical protein CL780_04315 [Chloroflexi bacterium]|nr:hypothetical protein [Chloroflexota bacterium]